MPRPRGVRQSLEPSVEKTVQGFAHRGHVFVENRRDLGRGAALGREPHAVQPHPFVGYEIPSLQPPPQLGDLLRRQLQTQRLHHHGSPLTRWPTQAAPQITKIA